MHDQSPFKKLWPKSMRDRASTEETIIADLTVAASDMLRVYCGLTADECAPPLSSRIVTRRDPSLDNYCAELLLRTCHESAGRMPDFREIVIRGTFAALESQLNPEVVGAVLIGIGGQSGNRDALRIYDEHAAGGVRTADSCTAIVFESHFERFRSTHDGVRAMAPVLEEVNRIDAHGGARQNHLSTMVKDLHMAQFERRGRVVEELPSHWKRAVVGGALAAVLMHARLLAQVDDKAAANRLRAEWKAYREKRKTFVSAGLLPAIDQRTIEQKKGQTADGDDPPHLLTLRKVLFALDRTWPADIASFIAGFLLEGMLQAQEDFRRAMSIAANGWSVPETPYSVFYYEMSTTDRMPHRGLLRRINQSEHQGVLVVVDRRRQNTAVFKSEAIPNAVWEAFVDDVVKTEPDCWFRPYDEVNKRGASFFFNGTRYWLGARTTRFTVSEFRASLRRAASR